MKLKKQLKCLAAIAFALTLVIAPAIAQNSKSNPPKPTGKFQAQQKNGIYDKAEVLPVYPGGNKGLMKFLSTNIKYPTLDRENNLSGRVVAQLTIEADGRVSNVVVKRSPSELMSAEAARVLKMSKWKPAKNNGKAVRAHFYIPVNFTLSDES